MHLRNCENDNKRWTGLLRFKRFRREGSIGLDGATQTQILPHHHLPTLDLWPLVE
jgi:hypothetical protein